MSRESAARRGADIVLRGFEEFHESFRAITRRAVERFEKRDWDGIRRDTERRLGLHARCVGDTLRELREELGERIDERGLWAAMRQDYSVAILGSDDFEVAQTFFNSLTRRVFSHVGVDPDFDYRSRDFPLPYKGWEMASCRMYAAHRVTPEVMRRVLENAQFRVPYSDIDAESEVAADVIRRSVEEEFGSEEIEALDFLRPVFIRNKEAYLVGRARKGSAMLPIVLAIRNEEAGLRLDGVVVSEEEISMIFSFAHWYFHADLVSPRQAIGFLYSILPRKRVSELYISLGYNKHGKTEFFSDLTSNIESTDERFVVAPGQPGLVMSVFTLPSYEFVFKVIKDHFPPSKNTNRAKIMQRYRQVLLHVRVGRLVDFQEFEHLTFPRAQFSEALLAELLEETSMNVVLEGDDVVIRHLYVGRRVIPLDLYLRTADLDQQVAAILDWGCAVKDLAAANIFAGDMLFKNFGLTRHGRVVFYDYDEICELTDCNFRRVPVARSEEQEFSDEPWFTVREGDVFPEQLETFLGIEDTLQEVFAHHHGDLFGVEFWRRMQERNREGDVVDFFPYTATQVKVERKAKPPIPAQ